MSDLFYRFKFRSDFFELELESTDSEFIDRKIMQLIELSTRPVEDGPKLLTASPPAHEEAPAAADEAPVEDAATEDEEEEEAVVEQAPEAPPRKKRKRRRRTTTRKVSRKKKTKAPEATQEEGAIDPKRVAEAIKSSDHFKTIQKKILDKSNQLNRILLSFYFAEQLFNGKGLTTGDVEGITDALGVGIKSTNVSSQLKKHEALFNSRGERKRGSVVHYTLNKDGKERFEKLLS